MVRIIFCSDDTCQYNEGGQACMCNAIHIDPVPAWLEQGKRVIYNACQDYKERENG